MVEPVAGLLGAFAVVLAEPLLPYALAFAAGAMVYVVVDDIIPEAQIRWAGKEDIKVDLVRFCVSASLRTFRIFLTYVPFFCSHSVSTSGNGKLASWTSILGFVVMMSLDVGLGWGCCKNWRHVSRTEGHDVITVLLSSVFKKGTKWSVLFWNTIYLLSLNCCYLKFRNDRNTELFC